MHWSESYQLSPENLTKPGSLFILLLWERSAAFGDSLAQDNKGENSVNVWL